MSASWIVLIVLMAINLILDKVAEKLQDELISAQEKEIKKQADLIEAQRKLIQALKGADDEDN